MIFNKSKKAIKIILSVVLIMALLASLSLSTLTVNAETTLKKASDDHSVVSDVATNAVCWKTFTACTTVSVNDENNLNFKFTNKSSTKDNTAYVYVDGSSELSLNQRVKATYTNSSNAEKNLITLFTRYRIVNTTDGDRPIGYVAQLSKSWDGTYSYITVTVYKWTVNTANEWQYNKTIGIIQVNGDIGMFNNADLSLEMVVTDTVTHKTNIAVNLYKNTTLAANTVIIDDDTVLNQKGSVGISSNAQREITLKNFEYTTTDNVSENNLFGYFSDTNAYLYQRLPLTAGKTYLIDALVAIADTSYSYSNENFAVEYIQTKTDLAATTRQKIELTKVETTEISDEFNHCTYKFTVPDVTADINNSYMQDADGNYFLMCDVGLDITIGKGLYSNIQIYDIDDEGKNNLFVNGDFKMGRYGWIKGGTHNFCFYGPDSLRLNESILSDSDNVKAIENYTNYNFYSKFKNTDLPQGDANCDKVVNICDLVATNEIIEKGDYVGTVDMDKNSKIDKTDFDAVQVQLLG